MSELDFDTLVDTVRTIVGDVRPTTLAHFRALISIERKQDESPVTIADQGTEKALREALSRHFPDHGLFGEEFGLENTDREYVWVIDPIDGTKSFISGVPLFGTLLALLKDGVPVFGAIQMPGLNEFFAGSKKGGSQFNGTPIQCRTDVAVSDAFVCCNEMHKLVDAYPDFLGRITPKVGYLRSTMDCYPYAQLAAGWVDGVIDYDLQPYDYLPVVGVVEGAGGIITDWQGNPLTMESDGRVIAAASPELHQMLLAEMPR